MKFAHCILLAALLVPGLSQASPSGTWHFKVLLDGKPIGDHTFRVSRDGDTQRVEVDARFKVKVLFVTVYAYQLEDREVWRNGCLDEISSRTRVNGRGFSVEGTKSAGILRVAHGPEDDASITPITGCVMSFAYWDKAILRQDRLLNVQTGHYMKIRVDDLGPQAVEIQGEKIPAHHYRLRAEKLDIDLWYGPGGEWLQLESRIRGRTLKYERLTPLPADLRIASEP